VPAPQRNGSWHRQQRCDAIRRPAIELGKICANARVTPAFPILQNIFKESVKDSWPEQCERNLVLENARLNNDPNVHLIEGLVQASTQPLTRVAESIDAARIAQVVNILSKAEIIFLLCSKRQARAQLGIANVLVDNVGSSAAAVDQLYQCPAGRSCHQFQPL
jgi:hypothetical protein